ncbi:MAG TPA: DoxX family protein, partial [bacterium]|nr:DoxX family protein [bacterium]
AAALLAPRLPRVKEWAYAGAFFNYSSAFVSHLFAGDRPDLAAALMAVVTVASWALRPPERRLLEAKSPGESSAWSWTASAAILVLLLILSFLWLPPIPGH